MAIRMDGINDIVSVSLYYGSNEFPKNFDNLLELMEMGPRSHRLENLRKLKEFEKLFMFRL